MTENDPLQSLYQYTVKLVAENDILRKRVELAKFVLTHEANTNGTQWVKDLLYSMEQVGRKTDD